MSHADQKGAEIANLKVKAPACKSCALEQLCLPAAIDADSLTRLDELVRQRRPLDRDELLFREGMVFQSIYAIRSGSLKTTVTLANGESQIVGFHFAGELVGFDALGENHYQCTAEALERSSLCEVPFAQLSEVASKIPGLQRQIYRVMSREFVRNHDHLVMMGRKQAQERFALFLKTLSDRHHLLGRDPQQFVLSMSRHDIANYLGMAVETVSRLIARFEQLKVAQIQRKQVCIINFVTLNAMAHSEESSQNKLIRAAG